jgi:uncharacterized protein with von Willebrand factor type A (vWA) domain
MTALREQLVRFIAALRSAGIRISVAESIDAMKRSRRQESTARGCTRHWRRR